MKIQGHLTKFQGQKPFFFFFLFDLRLEISYPPLLFATGKYKSQALKIMTLILLIRITSRSVFVYGHHNTNIFFHAMVGVLNVVSHIVQSQKFPLFDIERPMDQWSLHLGNQCSQLRKKSVNKTKYNKTVSTDLNAYIHAHGYRRLCFKWLILRMNHR